MTTRRHTRIEKRNRPQPRDLAADAHTNEKRLFLAICTILFLFAAWQSIRFYGHQVVPNSDFPGFYQTGRAILSFKLPATFKRAPVTGILQNLLTPFMPGRYPDLKAGWFLNALLHPLNGLLLFLIAWQLIGRAAKWFALICLLNPWVLSLMIDPIAETTLLFFILLTTWLIFERSRWSYLAASLATMVRYECAAFILAAFVVDQILARSKKERLLTLGLAAAASIPLGLWLLGTFVKESGSATHYFSVFKPGASGAFDKLSANKMAVGKHLELIWSVGYSNLASLPVDASEGARDALAVTIKIVAALTFLLGVIMAVIRKSWKVLVLAIFLLPYFIVHAWYPYPMQRFHLPSFWIALLISIYGLAELLKTAAQNKSAAKALVALQLVAIVVFVAWFFAILGNLARIAPMCPKAAPMPWIAVLAALLIALASLYLNRYRGALREIAVFSLLPVVIVSNQFPVAWLLGNAGTRDVEFKELADWYSDNGKTGERLFTTMTAVVSLYLPPQLRSQLVGYQSVEARDLADYARKLQQRGIVYVAWDSRLGFASKDPYYDLYRLQHFTALSKAQSIGPYRFMTQIRNGGRYVNVFRLETGSTGGAGR